MTPASDSKCDFFISRAGADAGWAQWIAHELENAGFTTFHQGQFPAGESWVGQMESGAACARTIAVLSPDYFKSPHTMNEMRAAFAVGRLLPIVVRTCEIPELYGHIAYIDLQGKTEDEARELLLRVVTGRPSNQPVSYPGTAPVYFPGPKQVSVAKLPSVSKLLIGREDELNRLDDAWTNPAIRLVSIVAFGGVGKTSLAINWWHRNGVPGAVRILGWSFYSQGAAEDRQASADAFLDYALREWFGVSDPPKDSWQRGELLAELIRHERTLLILDGLEPIQFPPGPQYARLKDLGMVALLKELAAHNPGLCVCTSRLPLTDLEDYGSVGVLSIDLDNLTPETGAQYLTALGVQGHDAELRQASTNFDNHALALTLLGNYLVKRRGGDIRKRDTMPPLLEYDASKGGQARRILRQYEALFTGKPELFILRILGLFDRPADAGALRVLRGSAVLVTLSSDDWATALENLKDARLIQYSDPNGPLDCHPLIREHFAEELRASDPDTFREAHSRLYEHYSKQAPHRPDNLEDMTPLFYGLYHGCQAGRHAEVLRDSYHDRILRTNEFFLTKKLGAFGTNLSLIANFFDTPWIKVLSGLSPADQSWVISQAGHSLRAVGRLAESIEPVKLGAESDLELEHWENAAISFGNLSQLYLNLARIPEAIDAARRSVDLADRGTDAFKRLTERTVLADAFHQSGDVSQAARMFDEAESIQAESQPGFPILYSLRGYLHRDLLLAQGQTDEVLHRSLQTLDWAKQYGLLLGLALDHLSLGRAYPAGSPEATSHLTGAVSGLRLAGQSDYLPLGFLARAAHFRHTRDFPAAQKDLDEVRILANRYGMRLHLTDYHLEQARLFLAQGQAADARPHYEAAKKLIEETGYHRRDSELAELAPPVA